jgi:chorismate-pyruvate lyase
MENKLHISAKLQSIQKLGEYFRAHYPDWKIVLLSPDWREDNGLFMREIYHEGKGKILAFARVEVPEETFFRFHVELQNLGDRSIGDHFLFVKDDVVREPFDIFETENGEWARRSRFLVEGYPLTITEYFTSEGLQCLLD